MVRDGLECGLPVARVEKKRNQLGESYRLRENRGTKNLDVWMRFHNRYNTGKK